ncbi:MAG: ABC transporter substrate-binding protein [Bacteroidales bacterium]|nr:ABC transporter substrate-binding protein [Bacteroidales bacterium]
MAFATEAKADSCMHLYYAKGFAVEYFPEYKRLTIHNPWGGKSAVYYLYRHQKPENLPEDAQAIQIPLNTIATTSCTHIGFLDRLGLLASVKGSCNLSMVYHPEFRKKAAASLVVDLGDNYSINAEKTLALQVDALIWSGYGQQDAKINFLRSASLPIIENNEWMEKDLLGRAEWLRCMAVLFDKEALADSLFQATVQAYNQLKTMAAEDSLYQPKSLMAGENFRGTWYVPGGRSYMAQLFRDAGASYLFENDTTSGSISLNLERVLRDMGHCDIWVGADAASLADLAVQDARYTWFDAYKNKAVYSYNRCSTPQGGNDFWERGVAHPDLLLSDFVKLLHPHLMTDREWNFLVALQ